MSKQTCAEQVRLKVDDLILSADGPLAEAKIKHISTDALRLFNYFPQKLDGKKFNFLLPAGKNKKKLRQLEENLNKQGGYSLFLTCRSAAGLLFKVGWLFIKQKNASNLCSYRGKILEIIRANHRWSPAHYFEHYDTLTGLPGRELLYSFLTDCMNNYNRYREPVTVITIDIDDFTDVNREFGLEAGDEVLKTVGKRLHKLTLSRGMVGRLGSDEFLLVLPRLQEGKKLETLLRNISYKITEPVKYQGNEISVTASMGVVELAEEDILPRELIDRSFLALERVRQNDGDSYRFFYPSEE
ncbi:MAG: GGDEF domain-containing protein [bacterium]